MSTFRLSPDTLRQIRSYANNHLDAAAIGELMNCEPSTIRNICNHHGITLARHRTATPALISTSVDLATPAMDRIRAEAARRGYKPSELIARVAEIVAEDMMFSAILDR